MMKGIDPSRTYLEFNEIVNFFFRSWIMGFRHLGWIVKNDKSNYYILNLKYIYSINS
jgi:hypothetical protein